MLSLSHGVKKLENERHLTFEPDCTIIVCQVIISVIRCPLLTIGISQGIPYAKTETKI